jgi:glutathione S-transferase
MTYTLWSTPHSLYSGKARCYLIKKALPFRERFPSDPHFASAVVPVVGAVVIPVVETSGGEILQDTTDIIDALEARHPEPAMEPATPVLRTVSMLLDAFGSNALLPLAMHYRWSYRAEQEDFLRAEFGRAAYAGADRDAQRQAGSRIMDFFNSFLPGLGVLPEAIPAMEAAWRELLDALDRHFKAHPYLLGARPSIGDCGLMAPLFAHLGRDPVPASLMKRVAPNVFRWTERMNTPGFADGEFADRAVAFPDDDTVPETLEPVLRLIFADWGPALAADTACFNAWVETRPEAAAGSLVSARGQKRVHPSVGPVSYPWRGVTIRRQSAPHGLWHFARATAQARSLDGEARRRLFDLIERTGGAATMALALARPMKRENYALVLG